MERTRGRWTDIVVDSNFAADDTGYLNARVDGERRRACRGRIVATPANGRQPVPNCRHGIFASYADWWERAHPGRPKPGMEAYYDEVLVGDTRTDVDTALREAVGLSAKD